MLSCLLCRQLCLSLDIPRLYCCSTAASFGGLFKVSHLTDSPRPAAIVSICRSAAVLMPLLLLLLVRLVLLLLMVQHGCAGLDAAEEAHAHAGLISCIACLPLHRRLLLSLIGCREGCCSGVVDFQLCLQPLLQRLGDFQLRRIKEHTAIILTIAAVTGRGTKHATASGPALPCPRLSLLSRLLASFGLLFQLR